MPPVTIPEPPRNPASRTGDLWILGDHRLLCGDSTSAADVRRLMNGERAILFATDPPYLVDYDGSNHPTRNKDWSASYGTTWDDSSQGAELYDGFIAAAVAEAIAEDAAWYCWHASRRQAMLEACWEKAGAFVHQQIIWVKDRGVLTRSHYLWKHEPCFMGWRRPNRPPKVAEQTLPSTWEMPSFAKDERPDHPTPKPLDAFGIPMRQHVARGGLCYEPFSGSGSQIMAGEANGRRVFAMEISPAYVDVAVERWQAETGRDAILDGDGRTFAQVRAERLGDEADAAGRCAGYYNDADPAACAWLREAECGRAAASGGRGGRVGLHRSTWSRLDLRGFAQCRISSPAMSAAGPTRCALAGVDGGRLSVWTGSTRPASRRASAGQRKGQDDDRHLAPAVPAARRGLPPGARLRRAGRQRGSRSDWLAVRLEQRLRVAAGWAWFDALAADLEAASYAVAAADLPAAGIGAPHIRQRLFFGAVASGTPGGLGDGLGAGSQGRIGMPGGADQRAARPTGLAGGLADGDGGLARDGAMTTRLAIPMRAAGR